MIETIAHLADIHVRKTPSRNQEYEQVFKRVITSLKKMKPSRIAVVGDLVHDYLDLQGEQLVLAHNFLKDLAGIAPVRIGRGNHDCRKSNLKRVDSIKAIVETLSDYDIIYYDKTGFYVDDNITWAVWHHGEKNNNPWRKKEGKTILANPEHNFTVDLFHDPVSGCLSTSNFEMKSKSYYKVGDFKGDLSLLGDIHKQQYLNKEKTKAYCGSLIAQDISEGDGAFHGYLLWDVATKTATEVPIKSTHSYHNVKITPYTDFDDLDFEIEDTTKDMTVRFLWHTLPTVRTAENDRSLASYVKGKYGNVKVLHKNEFVESEDIEIDANVVTLENVTDEAVQHEIFRNHLEKIGADDDLIEDIIKLDGEILNLIDIPVDQNIEWDIVKFGGTNFMSYGKLDIDWRNLDGLYQITGENTAGKTTLMKLISYILFNKTLETETRQKHGDIRFVNNRNGADSSDSYLVLEANGEYFGIKKNTTIERKRDKSVSKVPTKLSYYVLNSPDDEMTDDNALEKLDGDQRNATQKKIDAIIGSYENFKRIVMTTSDTLNEILSNDMATFIDSLLFDSGLDIFDKKLEGWKKLNKLNNEKSRVTCNVDLVEKSNVIYEQDISLNKVNVEDIEKIKLPEVNDKLIKGNEYIQEQTLKLYKIDDEIFNLDVDTARLDISGHNRKIVEIESRKLVLQRSISVLKETYDVEKLNNLILQRDGHKQTIYEKKMSIKEQERTKSNHRHQIEILNGKIFTLKRDGKTLKDEVTALKESKTCPTCGQLMTAEHQTHVDEKVNEKVAKMYSLGDDIKSVQNDIDTVWTTAMNVCDEEISVLEKEIVSIDLGMEKVLTEIGDLNNEKNDVERRKTLQDELDLIPTKIENEELNISIINQKITRHEDSLKQIEENVRINKSIVAAKEKVKLLEGEKTNLTERIFIIKREITDKELLIKNNETLVTDFKVQEHQDNVMAQYKKCVHRDGIPRFMLVNHILPKINKTLEKILDVADFKIWLDPEDLRPKLVYYSRPDSIVDCIGSSGKERTFSSVVLKFALNQINVKAKPSIFLLDEVMGKLDPNGVEEFKQILQLIKNNMKKVLVIEHTHEINPDHLITAKLDDDGISSLTLT